MAVSKRGRPPYPAACAPTRLNLSVPAWVFDGLYAEAQARRTNTHRLSVRVLARFIRHKEKPTSSTAC